MCQKIMYKTKWKTWSNKKYYTYLNFISCVRQGWNQLISHKSESMTNGKCLKVYEHYSLHNHDLYYMQILVFLEYSIAKNWLIVK